MASAFRAYTSFLTRRPLLGNVVSSAALFATGDLIAQQAIEKKGSKHDVIRTVRISAWGGLGFAPIVTVWMKFLQNKVTLSNKWAATAVRVGLDQFIAAPAIIATFFTVMTFLEGKGWEDAKDKIRKQWYPTLETNWKLFIPVQLANMAFVPLQYRVLVLNGVNIPWNAYLSMQNQKSAPVVDQVVDKVKSM